MFADKSSAASVRLWPALRSAGLASPSHTYTMALTEAELVVKRELVSTSSLLCNHPNDQPRKLRSSYSEETENAVFLDGRSGLYTMIACS